MRILMIHNFYGSEAPSGENKVVEMERRMLESYGHTVRLFARQSDEIRRQGSWGVLKGALSTVWNPWMARAVRREVEAFHPDIVHVHNTFPLISNAIFRAIGKRAKKVLTLHNYRTVCPAGIPMLESKVCTRCFSVEPSWGYAHAMSRCSVWPSLKQGCYRGSRFATIPLALSVALYRGLGTWRNDVDAIIVLSAFQKELMAKAGFPEAKMHVKGNFHQERQRPQAIVKEDSCVCVGRLSCEKGVRTLIAAWKIWGAKAPLLKIVGDGPLRELLEAEARNLNIVFLGSCSAEVTQQEMARSRLLILPSECYEGFPMVIPEAFAQGLPVAASDLGSLPSIVQAGVTGVTFPPAHPEQLYEVVSRLWLDQPTLSDMGVNARRVFEDNYTEAANYARLMEIYAQLHKGR